MFLNVLLFLPFHFQGKLYTLAFHSLCSRSHILLGHASLSSDNDLQALCFQ